MQLHLIDGTYELFRAHYSKRPDRTDPEGRDVKATVGVVGSLLQLLVDEDAELVAVAFDNPIESFRNQLFPGYKDSTGMDPALLAQFDTVERAVEALGVRVWSMDEVEADDALAAAAARWADDVEQVRIYTPDKDLGQAVRKDRVVQIDRRQQKLYDEAGVRERLGVGPRSVPDYLALVGDTADGIPGIRGFGSTTAAALLARYEHLEAIPPDPGAWEVKVRGASGLGDRLQAEMDHARLYRDLATLRTDIPLDEDLSRLAWEGVPRERFLSWCDELGVDHLRDRPHRFLV